MSSHDEEADVEMEEDVEPVSFPLSPPSMSYPKTPFDTFPTLLSAAPVLETLSTTASSQVGAQFQAYPLLPPPLKDQTSPEFKSFPTYIPQALPIQGSDKQTHSSYPASTLGFPNLDNASLLQGIEQIQEYPGFSQNFHQTSFQERRPTTSTDTFDTLPPNYQDFPIMAQFPEIPLVTSQPSAQKENVASPWLPRGVFPLEYPAERLDFLNWDLIDTEVELTQELFQERPDIEKSSYNTPLYHGATLTLHESLVSILSVALKFALSGQVIDSILGLINLHLPKKDNIFKNSLYLFKKYFSQIRGESSYTFYCSKCIAKCDKKSGCAACGKEVPLCCLITLPLVEQLKTLMARQGFYSKLVPLKSRFSSSGFADIYDGKLYKDHVSGNYIGELPDLSGEWYADGAEMFKSAKVSIWNLFFSINELPYSERFKKKNLLVPALWVGPVKPPSNLFFKSVMPDLKLLSSGVPMFIADLGKTEIVSFKIIGGTGDTPARALVMNMVAFNGEYSCQVCLQKGKSRDDCPGVRVFPYDPNDMEARTKENFEAHGEWAIKLKKLDPLLAYKGLHGTTPLSKITLDPVRGTAIDIMHNLYGGCAKLNLAFFVDASSSYTHLPCHLTKLDRNLVDDRIMQIKPPHYLTRVPKSIHEVASWQTSIHKSMFLYYGLPVLQGIVADEYFIHYSTLVAAAQLINSDLVTPQDLVKVDALIKRYLSCFPDLYKGDTYLTINFHLLLHLTSLVQEKGPAWTTACFPLESVNGEILKLVHGPRYPEMQITSSIHMSLGLEELVAKLFPGEVKDFCSALLSTTNSSKHTVFGENVIQGRWHQNLEEPPEYYKMLTATHPSLQGFHITTFNYLRRKNILYAAEACHRSLARNSSAVLYNSNDEAKTGILKTLIRASKCTCKDCQCECFLYALIEELEVVGVFPTLVPEISVPNTHRYRRLENYILLPVDHLKSVCVHMQIGPDLFISKRCNHHEVE